MVELLNNKSTQVAIKMLENDRILVKDLSNKKIFNKRNFLRIAVKSAEENDIIINSLLRNTGNI